MRLILALLVAALLATATARADDGRDQARAHADVARAAFEQGDYRRSLEEFRRSYDAAPFPELLYNIGRCQAELGQRTEAIASFRKYLAAKPAAEDRPAVEARIVELGKGPATPTTPVTVGAPVAPVLIVAAPKPIYRRWWPWTIGAVVLVGVVAAIVAVVVAGSASLDFPAVVVHR